MQRWKLQEFRDAENTMQKTAQSWLWWLLPVIPVLGMPKNKDCPKSEAILCYIRVPGQPGLQPQKGTAMGKGRKLEDSSRHSSVQAAAVP